MSRHTFAGEVKPPTRDADAEHGIAGRFLMRACTELKRNLATLRINFRASFFTVLQNRSERLASASKANIK
jgi:hypothetical protein